MANCVAWMSYPYSFPKEMPSWGCHFCLAPCQITVRDWSEKAQCDLPEDKGRQSASGIICTGLWHSQSWDPGPPPAHLQQLWAAQQGRVLCRGRPSALEQQQVQDQMSFRSSEGLCWLKMFEAKAPRAHLSSSQKLEKGSKQKHFPNTNICHLLLLLMCPILNAFLLYKKDSLIFPCTHSDPSNRAWGQFGLDRGRWERKFQSDKIREEEKRARQEASTCKAPSL